MRNALCLLLLLSLLTGGALSVQLVKVYENTGRFENPVDLQTAPGDSSRVFVVEKAGRIAVFDTASQTVQTFLNIASLLTSRSSEQGLLGLAFHPSYQTNGYFFVYYTDASTGAVALSRFQRAGSNPVQADPGSELRFLTISQPFSNHNGGQIQFGPDNFLYVAVGDGGSANDPQNSGQDTDTLLGNLLRIDVDQAQSASVPYSIPTSNPFAQGGGAPEIYVYGLRNPWRFSFDSETGLAWIADVGQNAFEEINVASSPGQNFGWKTTEGCGCTPPATQCDTAGFTMPVHVYPRNVGRSVTGGYVYHGDGLGAALKAHYFFADYVTGSVFALDTTAAQSACGLEALVIAESTGLNIGTFGLIHDQVLIADYRSGVLFKLSPDPSPSFTATPSPTVTGTATATVSPTASVTAAASQSVEASDLTTRSPVSGPSSTATESPLPSGTPAPSVSSGPSASASTSAEARFEDPTAPLPPQQFSHRREAITAQDASRNIVVEWDVDGEFVHFSVSGTAVGYVAMGFSTDGTMNSGRSGSDIVMGYIDSGTGQSRVNDYWALSYGQPELDEQQNLQHVSATRNGGLLTVAFTRPLRTIDSFEDRALLADGQPMFFIWAMSDEEPRDIDSFAFHIARGDFYVASLRDPDGAVVSTTPSPSPSADSVISRGIESSATPSPFPSAPAATRSPSDEQGQETSPSSESGSSSGSDTSTDSSLDGLSSLQANNSSCASSLSMITLGVLFLLMAI